MLCTFLRRLSLIALLWAGWNMPAFAVPGPDSVAVIANVNDAESVALAELYRVARSIPTAQICLLDLPAADTIPLADYFDRLEAPFESCLASSGALARVEAVALMRGVPLRVAIPVGNGTDRASLAATLGAWKSVTSSTSERLIAKSPGLRALCGSTPCLAARWRNPYTSGVFRAGFESSVLGVDYRILLVTMIHGRTFQDAARLVASATTAEALGGATGDFLFMNGADPARGVLDTSYDAVISALAGRGFSAERIPFDANLTGRSVAGFFVGTASLGTTIEGNDFLPGALVDNVTSFGAVPPNFADPGSEVQVSIARWVAKGVAGVHGTTDEPLNNCFPSRNLILSWVDGGTLAEAYHRALPFVFWQNLVLGDPMAAPYAQRPTVTFEQLAPGETVVGSKRVRVRAEDPRGRIIESLALFVDGVEVARHVGAELDTCLAPAVSDQVELLAVAQVENDGSAGGRHQPKGWSSMSVRVTAGPSDCVEMPDAGVLDAGDTPDGSVADAGATVPDASEASTDAAMPAPDPVDDEGCGCHATRANPRTSGLPALLALCFWWTRRRRAGRRSAR